MDFIKKAKKLRVQEEGCDHSQGEIRKYVSREIFGTKARKYGGKVTMRERACSITHIACAKTMITTTTTTKPFVPSIWGRLHEPKENYAGSGTNFGNR